MRPQPRPAGVTVVAILAWIAGALDVLAGVLLMAQSGVESIADGFGGSAQLFAAATGSIVLGAIVLIVATGLLSGNPAARMVITVVQVLSIIGSLFLAIAYMGGAVTEWIGIAVSCLVLALLWTKRASGYFSARS